MFHFFETPDGRYLAEMPNREDPSKRLRLGAVVPGQDGNYYDHLCVASTDLDPMSCGAEKWLAWVKDAVTQELVCIDSEFPFDPNEVKIVTFRKETP